MRSLFAASLILLPAFAASAQTPSAGQPEAPKKICKVDPEDTDSRVRRRICKTEAEWNGDSGKKSGNDQPQRQSQ